MPCEQALYLTLLHPLAIAGTYEALSPLNVAQAGDHYTDRALQTSLICLSAAGVLRMAHINDQPIQAWGTVLNVARRPDGDTLDQYLRGIQAQETPAEVDHGTPDRPSACETAPVGPICPAGDMHDHPLPAADGQVMAGSDRHEQSRRHETTLVGQVRPDGLIAQAQNQALSEWAEAGLFQELVWYFDGHTIEYTGQAPIGKTLHGTKHTSVKAVDEYCLFNHIPGLTCYFPTHVSYEQALRQMVTQAQATLPHDRRIQKLAFDKEGWNADLITWLVDKATIIPLTWVKDTSVNRNLLASVDTQMFVDVEDELTIGKSDQEHRVVRIADVDVPFPDLGTRRVVVLETDVGTRLGIFTTALRPTDAPLDDERVMPTLAVMDAMRYKQRIENSFKVRRHEMNSDALPTHRVHEVTRMELYDLGQAQTQATRAASRLARYQTDQLRHTELLAHGEIDQHEFNVLTHRTARLQAKTHRQQDRLAQEMDRVKTDAHNGQPVIERTIEVLDVRKLTLLNLFKDHTLVILHLLAHGDRVEFDHAQGIMTVYAKPFPRRRTQQAYERLCACLNERPVTFVRDGRTYRVRFSW